VAKAIEGSLRRISIGSSSLAAPLARRIAVGILPSVSQHGLLVNRISQAVLEVQGRHPALKLVVQEAPNGTLQDWVMRGLVGVAIVETSLPHVPRLPLGSSEGLAVIAHAGRDPLPKGPVTFADTLRLPLALPTSRFGLRQLLDAAAEQRAMRVAPYMEIDALTMIVAVLAQAPVCTVLPPSAVGRELAQGELVAHPIVDPTIARRLFVIYSGERSLSAPERDLVKTLRVRLSQSEPGRGGLHSLG
jgi:DNA-binding transcriptional LysR family regulator